MTTLGIFWRSLILIISIDFDGTIAKGEFPEITGLVPFAKEVIQALKEEGNLLILWTCREDHISDNSKQYLKDAIDFCESHGIIFDSINEALPDEDFRHEDYKFKRKPFADVYIDDRNLGGFPGWLAVAKELLEWDRYVEILDSVDI